MDLSTASTGELASGLHAIAADATPPDGDTLNIALLELEDAVGDAFTNMVRTAMKHVPAAAAPMAERAVRSVILDAVSRALDTQLDRADQIRAKG